jgi:proteic killer suppression protein
MIRTSRDGGTEDLFCGRSTKAARKTLPQSLWSKAAKKLDAVDSAGALDILRIPRYKSKKDDTVAG